MRYLSNSELVQFHDALLKMFEKHTTKVVKKWGFPAGAIDCDTYPFNTKHESIYIGHHDLHWIEKERWWIPIALLDEQDLSGQLPIAFEMCIPKTNNMNLSVHYGMGDNRIVHILHKGKFTVGHGGVSMGEFFDYYRQNPGKWQLINFNHYEYLLLGKVHLVLTDTDLIGLLDSLAEFARYIPSFKSRYRG